MKTYSEVYKAVRDGKIVTITSHFGNTRTYFLRDGKLRQQFNNCKDSMVYGDGIGVSIDCTSVVKIHDTKVYGKFAYVNLIS